MSTLSGYRSADVRSSLADTATHQEWTEVLIEISVTCTAGNLGAHLERDSVFLRAGGAEVESSDRVLGQIT